jgi:hypothetical protein
MDNSVGANTFVTMLQRTIAILLIVSLSMHCLGRLGLVAQYQLNKDYITRVFCINKAQPKLQCNGKCYLAKQLKAQQEREQKLPLQQKYSQEIVFVVQSYFQFEHPVILALSIDFPSFYLLKPYHSPQSSIYHPPKV